MGDREPADRRNEVAGRHGGAVFESECVSFHDWCWREEPTGMQGEVTCVCGTRRAVAFIRVNYGFHSQPSNRWDVKVRAEEFIRFSFINEHTLLLYNRAGCDQAFQGVTGTWCISDCALVKFRDPPTFYCMSLLTRHLRFPGLNELLQMAYP